MPRVSVIIPNYNHAPFLEERLRSVLDQTYRDFEIIFLDDASTDDSREVFAPFSDDARVRKTLFNDTNSGSTYKQWNRGIREAEGELLWIAESDDSSDPAFLEAMVGALDGHPQAGLAFCRSRVVDEAGADQGLYHNRVREIRVDEGLHEDKVRILSWLIMENFIPNASSVLMRRELCERVGGAAEHMRMAGDWMLWSRMLSEAGFLFLERPLNFFRSHGGAVRNRIEGTPEDYKESAEVILYIAGNARLPSRILRLVFGNLLGRWPAAMALHALKMKRPHFRAYRDTLRKVREMEAGLPLGIALKSFGKEICRSVKSIFKSTDLPA